MAHPGAGVMLGLVWMDTQGAVSEKARRDPFWNRLDRRRMFTRSRGGGHQRYPVDGNDFDNGRRGHHIDRSNHYKHTSSHHNDNGAVDDHHERQYDSAAHR